MILWYRVAILMALLWAPTACMLVWAHSHEYRMHSLVAICVTAALLFLLVAGLMRAWRRFFLAFFPLFLLSVAFFVYALLYRMTPGHTLSMLLAGASWEELRGFVTVAQGRQLALLLAVCTAAYLMLAFSVDDTAIFTPAAKRSSRLMLVLLLPATVYAAWDSDELIDGIGLNPMSGSLMFFGGALPQAMAELRGSKVVKAPYHATRVSGEEVHVFIVGESARRASWAVYGYGRPTTPYLSSLRPQLILLENAVADANLTEWAVPMLLTGMPPDAFEMGTIRGNIVDLAKEAGYSTTWLVNQDIGISTSVGIAPDKLVVPPDLNANINGRHTFDEVLLPAYRSAIRDGGAPRFIGIHMMGSHWEYYRRYPDRFRRFGSGEDLSMLSIFLDGAKTAADVVDAYDNTVLYTDWFLGQLIEEARALQVPATLTYFPDHGEDLQALDGQPGHGQPVYTPHAFDLPAFIWVNEAYRRAHPERVAALQANAAKEVRSHDVFYTLADLMGIHWPGAKATRSMASAEFIPDTDMRHIAGGVLVARH